LVQDYGDTNDVGRMCISNINMGTLEYQIGSSLPMYKFMKILSFGKKK